MKTYVKIEGENIASIVQKLAKLAVDSPEICVWDINIVEMGWTPYPSTEVTREMGSYFGMGEDLVEKHCDRIISKSGADLGDANIYFEWLEPPSDEQLRKLKSRIDGVLKPFGNKYIVTNRA